jgi:hypothetical protein
LAAREAQLLAGGVPAILEPVQISRMLKERGNPGPGQYENPGTFKTVFKDPKK